MKEINLSPSIKTAIAHLSKTTDNLLSRDNISILLKGYKKEYPKRITNKMTININKMIEQLPEGIYTNIRDIIALIKSTEKRNTEESLNYSPLVLTFKEFSCCKLMKHGSGHIITGRDIEIEQILLTMCKQSKRGIILVGEPGVGKTAVVKAINARLIERTIPRKLIGAQIFNLDVPYVFAKYKEDPIGTIIKVLERAAEYDKAIIFIDEVHQLLGHKMNDIMKPYLTEQIRFIGSTTINEYHSIITDDTALERRFTVINIDEPNLNRTTGMVIGTKAIFEEHHKCTISDEICKYAVETGSRFLGHRRNPDKSLDLVDLACTIMSEKEIILNKVEGKRGNDVLENLNLRKKELDSMIELPGKRILSEKYVNEAISVITSIPFNDIQNSLEFNQVVNNISSKIVSQSEQIRTLSNVVNIFKHIKSDRVRPVSIILVVGGPGVGKKASARLLAKNLYGDENSLISFDMSGFTSEFSITELKGSPPGYVGYGKSGRLIKDVRNKPQSVVYFEHMDMAAPPIRQYLIDACKSGKLLDSAEREASLNNAVIIFSLTLSKENQKLIYSKGNKTMGFSKQEESSSEYNKAALSKLIGEEILELANEVIVYDKLTEKDLEKIYENNLEEYLEPYKVGIDKRELRELVLSNSTNGHDIINKLSSEIPKLVFKKLQGVEK